MVTGIKSGGTDLDSLLEPRTTTKIDDVNIKSNGGVDISNRFENITSGTGPSSLGISRTSGIKVDLSLLFAGIGTVGGETKQLDTTITSAPKFDGTKKTKRVFSGFDAGADIKGLDSFGSIASGNYTDGGSSSRVVTAFYFNSGGQASNNTGSIWLSITTTPSDTNTTFSKVILDGTTFTRSSASATGLASGSRWWRWDPGFPDPFAGTNPDPFELWTS